MHWHPIDGGATLGQTGSEGGVIARDDEYPDGARITLEEGGVTAPFSITCGVYGWMAHTSFFSTREEADAAYEAMKPDLAAMIAEILASDENDPDASRRVVRMIEEFVDRYP